MFIDATSLHGDALEQSTLERRQFGYGYGGGLGGRRYGYSRWSSWGRWVLLGVIIVVFVLLFLACSCMTARKRRKRGAQPMYGTGWMAGKHGTPQYYPQNENATTEQPVTSVGQNYYGGYNQGNDVAPAYSPQGGGQSNGYYGQSTELQQPSNAYQPARGGQPVYEAPPGPPPGGKV